ncbi:hypothetical protein [Okeania hirsuta]|uniref:hypothetical protein n=1 Tax=Okeania hirsuta TaxID=1458930 RepID=UPI0013750E16|nr:hypothetical protein [Okeania hirsuta]NET74929.1 hypothetical protein [Okeania sp. SIO1F9]
MSSCKEESGVNPPLAPPPPKRGTQESGGKKKKKVFGRVSGTEFYRAIKRT